MAKQGTPDPAFIIKAGNTYYLTTGVLEYDEARAANNLTRKKGVKDVKDAFNAVSDDGATTVRQVVLTTTLTSAAQTMPDN